MELSSPKASSCVRGRAGICKCCFAMWGHRDTAMAQGPQLMLGGFEGVTHLGWPSMTLTPAWLCRSCPKVQPCCGDHSSTEANSLDKISVIMTSLCESNP